MSPTFAPADPGSTPSESTAPSTDSPTQLDDKSPSAEPEATATEHDPNVTWGDDDPDKPEGWEAP